MKHNLVLASGSSYKQELMRRLALPFQITTADIDEARKPGETPAELASRLAREKAAAVAQLSPNDFVIGTDQVIALDNVVFTKPGTVQAAVQQLQTLRGKTHELLTAVAVIAPDGKIYESTAHYAMNMRDVNDQEIENYIREDSPLDCAGAYKIEQGGIRLFRSLQGDDYTAIIGLPLTHVRHLLETAGYFSSLHSL